MLVAIDVETKARPEASALPEASLVPHLAEITVIGAVAEDGRRAVFRGPNKVRDLETWLPPDAELTGHNFKFDLKHLVEAGGSPFLLLQWAYDSQLMAHVHTIKVTEGFLKDYEARRRELNAKLPKGFGHREAGPLSLKSLAPFFLDVPAFWEATTDHDNDEYVLKDAEYTLQLTRYFRERMSKQELTFFRTKQLPWTKMLFQMERRGIVLDPAALSKLESDLEQELQTLEANLKETWREAYEDYEAKKRRELFETYDSLASGYLIKYPEKDKQKVGDRYLKLYTEAASKADFALNLASPTQLTWLLRDKLGYDIRNFQGEETTDKEVLQKLSQEGKEDVRLLLQYREASKIKTAYIPAYRSLLRAGTDAIHPSFNPAGTKTGRLSCALPNLQQCPAEVRALFRPRKRTDVFITKDFSMLEPVLIGYYSQDPALKEIIKTGKSFHSVNAQILFNLDCAEKEVKKLHPQERDAAKEAGLSILYGAGANRLLQSLQKRGFKFSLDQCKFMVRKLRENYAGVWEFKTALDRALEAGETIYNYMGRPISFSDPDEIYMKAFNRLIQGSGSDILQQACFDISNDPNLRQAVTPLLLVHDELVAEIDTLLIDVRVAERAIDEHMTKFDLGDLKLHTEGGVANEWRK